MDEADLEGRQSSRGMSIWSLSGSGMKDGMKNPNLCCVELNSDVSPRLFASWVFFSRRKPNWAFSGPESEIPSRIDGNRWESMALSHRFLALDLLCFSIDANRWGDTARIMPDDIAEKILGREGLFELVVSSEGLHVDGFNVSRLTIDDEIKDVYIMINYPAANPEDDSFSETLDYVEIEDRASKNNVQTGAPKDAAAEVDSEPTHTSKRQKRE
ncbi:hypothetical protein CASFOL_002122 [Castilleja foliolosa]|uniref:Uncharacterized protein n=1 Tax=Castilleja foliolosa TaxID=1961234 RepID=A0ABD3EE30_9LAMI